MTKQWFVLHTLTGQEQKVKRSIEARVRIEEMGEYIGEVVIPTEKVSEVKNGVKTTVTRKFFPGYVLINLVLYDEARAVLEPTWRFLKETSGVIGFIGLIVPHLVRLAMRNSAGNDQRLLLPASVLAGGTLLVAADTLARTVVAPQQLPVGVLTALLGVPAFLYLLSRQPRPSGI